MSEYCLSDADEAFLQQIGQLTADLRQATAILKFEDQGQESVAFQDEAAIFDPSLPSCSHSVQNQKKAKKIQHPVWRVTTASWEQAEQYKRVNASRAQVYLADFERMMSIPRTGAEAGTSDLDKRCKLSLYFHAVYCFSDGGLHSKCRISVPCSKVLRTVKHMDNCANKYSCSSKTLASETKAYLREYLNQQL